MTIPDWLFLFVVIPILTLFALIVVVFIALTLIGLFCKGCDVAREDFNDWRPKK